MSPAPHSKDTVDARQRLIDAGVLPGDEVRFVALLIRNRLITMEQVPELVARARAAGRSLPDQALTSGIASEEALLGLTAQLHGIEPVLLAQTNVEEQIAQLISLDEARNWGVLPYSRTDNGDVLVAISDPSSVQAVDNLPRALATRGIREKVIWRLASNTELNAFIDATYRNSTLGEKPAAAGVVIEETERLRVRGQGVEGSTVKLVDDLVYNAVLDGASDIHIAPRRGAAIVKFRVDGELTEVMQIPRSKCTEVIARIKNMAGMRPDETRDAQDGRVTFDANGKDVDLRIVTIPVTVPGWERPERVVMRVLDPTKALLTLDRLGMSRDNLDRFDAAIARSHGLALVTGPTGSGKSTTLYAAMNSRMRPGISLASIEDPVEYQLEGIDQTSVSGSSKLTFASALRAQMRADPDIIMVGEIRDSETARTAVEASLTGHFIYSTLHTNDAIGSLTRLRDLGVDSFLLSSTLQVIVAQRLIRVLCPDCKIAQHADAAMLEAHAAPQPAIDHARQHGPMPVFAKREGGCQRCKRRGFRGRTGVHEVLTFTDEMRRMIIQPDIPVEDIETLARQAGMHSLREDAFRRVQDGLTSLQEFAEKVA